MATKEDKRKWTFCKKYINDLTNANKIEVLTELQIQDKRCLQGILSGNTESIKIVPNYLTAEMIDRLYLKVKEFSDMDVD